jgi:hypothetical protein
MGPVGFVFLAIAVIFGVIGIVRGYTRELGVTTMLFVALLALELMAGPLEARFVHFLTTVFGVSPEAIPGIVALIACVFLSIVVFISYQGVSLAFPGKGESWFLGLCVGLLNGYLFAGSLWYYLQAAGWPLLHDFITPQYSQLNLAIQKLLPPAIFSWQILAFLVIFMLIMRVWK